MKITFDDEGEKECVVGALRRLCSVSRLVMPIDDVRMMETLYVIAKTGLSTRELEEHKHAEG